MIVTDEAVSRQPSAVSHQPLGELFFTNFASSLNPKIKRRTPLIGMRLNLDFPTVFLMADG